MSSTGFKYLVYFVSVFIACYLTQQIIMMRLIAYGPYYITGGSFIFFSSSLILDIVAEVYGYRIAKQVINCGMFSLLFLSAALEWVLHTPYPLFISHTAKAYNDALGSIPYACVMSTISIFFGQRLNAYLISRWRVMTRGRYFWLRSVGSSILGDGLTVSLSILLIFHTRVSTDLLIYNLLPELIVMVSFSALGAFPAWFLAGITAKAEGIDRFNFVHTENPFCQRRVL